jgi:hypothetical protein
MAVVNSWLLHKRDTIFLDMPRESVLALSDFEFQVAFALMEAGKLINKRGRPSACETPESKRQKTKHVTVVPQNSVRYDQVGHWHSVAEARRICHFEGCANRTNVACKNAMCISVSITRQIILLHSTIARMSHQLIYIILAHIFPAALYLAYIFRILI